MSKIVCKKCGFVGNHSCVNFKSEPSIIEKAFICMSEVEKNQVSIINKLDKILDKCTK